MEVSVLKPDELEVEFEVRGILAGADEAIGVLKKKLEEEQEGNTLAPTKMHARASKNPEGEIEACRIKLNNYRRELINLKNLTAEEQADNARIMNSRLKHVLGRLKRASSSPTYGEAATKMSQAGGELLSALEKYMSDHDLLDQSIDSAKRIDIGVIPSDTMKKGGLIKVMGDGATQSEDQSKILTTMMAQLQQISGSLVAMTIRQTALEHRINSDHTIKPVDNQDSGDAREPQMNVAAPPILSQFAQPGLAHVHFQDPTGMANAVGHSSPLPTLHDSVPISSGPQGSPLGPQHHPYFGYPPTRIPLSRCGVTYNGTSSGTTVDMFLFQLDTLTSTMRLTPEILLYEVSTILKDMALQWYWTYRKHNPLANWFDLRCALIERFRDRRSNYEIRRMVESRRQLPTETFMDFYNQVWTLSLQCHTPYPDEEFIQILMTNMKPALQFHLTDRRFSTIPELIQSCTAWEDTFKRVRYQPEVTVPLRRNVSELSADWVVNNEESGASQTIVNTDVPVVSSVAAYQIPSKGPEMQAIPPMNMGAATNPRPTAGTPGILEVCFNCSDIGHRFKNCPIPPIGIFCYRCGQKDTISRNCNRCAGNRTGGPGRSGTQRPPATQLPRINQATAACNTDPELSWRQRPSKQT